MKNALRWKGNGRYRLVNNPTNNWMIVKENENWKIYFHTMFEAWSLLDPAC